MSVSSSQPYESHKSPPITQSSDFPLERSSTVRHRHISALQVALLGFFQVAGGPVGVEPAVKAGGPLLTLIAMVVVPLSWAMPQAWITAEMSTIFDDNGGSILWVESAFGPFFGWLNAHNNVVSNLFDLALYPVLAVDALNTQIALSDVQRSVIAIALCALVFFLNVQSLQVVGKASAILCFSVLLPFVVQAIVAAPDLKLNQIVGTVDNVKWSLFVNTLLWNFTGFDNLGDIAGEVIDPQRSYPIGILLSIVLITLNYLVPVCTAVALSSADWNLFNEGYFVAVAASYAPWLGHWIMISSVFSLLGSFNVMNASSGRALYRVSRVGMLPKCFSYEWDVFNSPVAALVFQLGFTSILVVSLGSFTTLVEIDNFLSILSLLLETASFLRIRISHPDLHRPFRFPGSTVVSTLVVVPKCILLLAALCLASTRTWVICGCLNLALVIVYPFWSRFHGDKHVGPMAVLSQQALGGGPTSAQGAV